jgi:hypothetical protein
LNNKRTAPITDIRAKKQSSTINLDDLPPSTIMQKKFIDVNNTINAGSNTGNNRNRMREFTKNDGDAQTSLERDI